MIHHFGTSARAIVGACLNFLVVGSKTASAAGFDLSCPVIGSLASATGGGSVSSTAGCDLSFPVIGSMSTNTARFDIDVGVPVTRSLASATNDSVSSVAGFGLSFPVTGSMTKAIGDSIALALAASGSVSCAEAPFWPVHRERMAAAAP